MRPVRRLYGDQPVSEFGPLALKVVRNVWVKNVWVKAGHNAT